MWVLPPHERGGTQLAGVKAMKKCLKGLKWFVLHIEEIVSVVAISIMLCVVCLNVFARYVFRAPTAWSDEVAIICLAYVTFVGGAAAYKRNLHFGIDILLDKMPETFRMAVRRISNFVFILMFGFCTYLGYQLTINAKKVMNYTGWSYKIMDAALPLGFLSMTIYAIYFFIMSFRDKEAYKKRYESVYESNDGEPKPIPEQADGGNDK